MKKFIITLLILFSLTSCVTGPAFRTNLDFWTSVGEELVLEYQGVNVYENGKGGTFNSTTSLEKIKEKILEKNDCEAYIYDDTLVIEKNINDTIQIGIISDVGKYYIYEQPHIILQYDDDSTIFMAPTYLIDVKRVDSDEVYINENEWYKIKCSETEFIEFYQKTKMFEIAKGEYYRVTTLPTVRKGSLMANSLNIQFKTEENNIYLKYSR